MHLANRYATRVILASFTALAISSFLSFAVSAQDPTQQQKGSTDKPAGNGTTATAAPSPPPKQRLGIELDDKDRSVITNTDLITLTVTVTDTYGRYVSGLGKGAFSVMDNKEPVDITYFSDDDSPVSVGVIFDVSGSMSGDKVKRDRDALGKFIAAPSPPGENLAYKMNVSFPALPRRAGLLSSVSEMRTPKPGTRVSNSSTR